MEFQHKQNLKFEFTVLRNVMEPWISYPIKSYIKNILSLTIVENVYILQTLEKMLQKQQ